MKCWHCESDLIWDGDQDLDEDNDYDIVTNLTCPECNAFVQVYHHKSPSPVFIELDLNEGLIHDSEGC